MDVKTNFNPVGPCHTQTRTREPEDGAMEEMVTPEQGLRNYPFPGLADRLSDEWEGHLFVRFVDGHIVVHSGCQWSVAHSFKDVEKQVSVWLEQFLHPWLVKRILATQKENIKLDR